MRWAADARFENSPARCPSGGVPLAFELRVVSNVPLTAVGDLREVAHRFLEQIGYLAGRGEGAGGGTGSEGGGLAYRLFTEAFLARPERGWTADQLARRLETTRATVYRHLNKLKSLDLLESVEVSTAEGPRKGYRIRYGDLAKAWNFVEAHVEVAMENYRKTVDHLQKLASGGVRGE